MTNEYKAAEDAFWQTRLEAKAAYKKYVSEFDKGTRTDFFMAQYTKAWQKHQEASMALFLIECGEV